MDPLIINNIIIASAIRIAGLFVSIDFFIRKRDIKFIYFILSWSFMFLSEFLLLFIFSPLINAVFGTLGLIFGDIGLLTYFTEVKKKSIIKIFLIIIATLLSFFFFLGEEFTSKFIVLIFTCSFLLLICLPFIFSSRFKKQIGKSIFWYYAFLLNGITFFPISYFSIANGTIFDVYYLKNNILIMSYFCGIIVSELLFLIFLIHIEYNHSFYVNINLKDKYSHDLGNILQHIQSGVEILSYNLPSEEEKSNLFELILKKSKEASDLINKIRTL